jgi:hypothetical protein
MRQGRPQNQNTPKAMPDEGYLQPPVQRRLAKARGNGKYPVGTPVWVFFRSGQYVAVKTLDGNSIGGIVEAEDLLPPVPPVVNVVSV